MYTIEIRHNFETAHRLASPDAPVKCQSIHGHSWWVTATISGESLDSRGILVEFGEFKRAWRRFLDDKLDHHLVVSTDDPVLPVLRGVLPELRVLALDFAPTTENLAKWIFEETERLLRVMHAAPSARLSRIHVQETRANAASFSRD